MLDDVMAGRPATKPAPPFGRKLAEIRKDLGMTQPQLADLLGVTLEMVDYYERRARNPSAETIQKVAAALRVPASSFLDDGAGREKKRPGPASQFEARLNEARKLPRKKQEILLRMIDTFLEAERRAST